MKNVIFGLMMIMTTTAFAFDPQGAAEVQMAELIEKIHVNYEADLNSHMYRAIEQIQANETSNIGNEVARMTYETFWLISRILAEKANYDLMSAYDATRSEELLKKVKADNRAIFDTGIIVEFASKKTTLRADNTNHRLN